VHIETRISVLFSDFYGGISSQASLRELRSLLLKLRALVLSSVSTLFVSLMITATMAILLSFVFMQEMGLRPMYMSILRVASWAMAFHTSAMFCFVFLLYFDLRKPALLVVSVFCVTNAVLTILLLPLGPLFYGYGIMIAGAITFLLSFAMLLHEMPWLHYHAFITNNSSL
ncbi:MAG: exopolysaccharide Pel transporter PelG, partial [Acetobacteraceae bacterium]